jgi:hypothetical protein
MDDSVKDEIENCLGVKEVEVLKDGLDIDVKEDFINKVEEKFDEVTTLNIQTKSSVNDTTVANEIHSELREEKVTLMDNTPTKDDSQNFRMLVCV